MSPSASSACSSDANDSPRLPMWKKSGFLPRRSRASSSRRRGASQIANANMPRSLLDERRPVQAVQLRAAPRCRSASASGTPAARSSAAQLAEVVDLAVEHQHDLPVGAEHRLVRARRQVDDRQARVAQRGRAAAVNAGRVRAAVMQARPSSPARARAPHAGRGPRRRSRRGPLCRTWHFHGAIHGVTLASIPGACRGHQATAQPRPHSRRSCDTSKTTAPKASAPPARNRPFAMPA